MSAPIKDGGPAFPRTLAPHENCSAPINGMTLRDWFAGQALVSFAQNFPCGGFEYIDTDNIARGCYKMADAMIAQREKGQS